MKAAAQVAMAFWVGVALLLAVAAVINGGFEHLPAGCKTEVAGAGIHAVCPEPVPTAFWRIKRIKCKGKEGNHCHTFWTVGPQPKLDQG